MMAIGNKMVVVFLLVMLFQSSSSIQEGGEDGEDEVAPDSGVAGGNISVQANGSCSIKEVNSCEESIGETVVMCIATGRHPVSIISCIKNMIGSGSNCTHCVCTLMASHGIICPPDLPGLLNTYHSHWVFDLNHHDLRKHAEDLTNELQNNHSIEKVDALLSITLTSVVQMVAVKNGWKKECHMHPSDALLLVLKGKYYFKLHSSQGPIKLKAGSQMMTPQWHAHAEGNNADEITIILIKWTPVPNINNLTIPLPNDRCENAQFPGIKTPILKKLTPLNFTLSKTWTATALLQPFGPRQTSPNQTESPSNPFEPFAFQLSVATMTYRYRNKDNGSWVIFVKGCNDFAESWFKVTQNENLYSTDGLNWQSYWLNWTLPSLNWMNDQTATYAGSSPLNWMAPHIEMDWWKITYEGFERDTWFWFQRNQKTKKAKPFRLMFSFPPPESGKGNSSHLAFFQMFSFSYIVFGKEIIHEVSLKNYLTESTNNLGLTCGNVDDWPVFEWPRHLELSSFSTPIDPASLPLPTRVSYHWGEENQFVAPFTRVQKTRFDWIYNKNQTNPKFYSEAVLFGESHKFPGQGFSLTQYLSTWETECEPFVLCKQLHNVGTGIGQQPPWWPSLTNSTIFATIQKPNNQSANWVSPLTGSNQSVAILGVLFPKSTYLWTWYDYTELDDQRPFTKARPITFMQSDPGVGEGTNLALADYFDYYPINLKRPYFYNKEQLNKFCPRFNGSEQQRSVPRQDLLRAKQKVPRNHYKGKNFTHMVQVLNEWLNSSTSTKPCEEWDVKELQDLQIKLYQNRDPDFDNIYAKSADNRRLLEGSLKDLINSWNYLNNLADKNSNRKLQIVRRNGHCYEAVMWFVHHLSEDTKNTFRADNITIPLLPLTKHDGNEYVDMDSQAIFGAYRQQVTCSTCHGSCF